LQQGHDQGEGGLERSQVSLLVGQSAQQEACLAQFAQKMLQTGKHFVYSGRTEQRQRPGFREERVGTTAEGEPSVPLDGV
jgi:hypothetical protein